MTACLKNLKKIIRNLKYIIKLENDISIYFKYHTNNELRTLKRQNISFGNIKKLHKCLIKIKETVLSEIEKQDLIEKDVLTQLCKNGKSTHIVTMECYVGLSTLYRIVNNFAISLYYVTLEDKEFKISINYVINQLQNNF